MLSIKQVFPEAGSGTHGFLIDLFVVQGFNQDESILLYLPEMNPEAARMAAQCLWVHVPRLQEQVEEDPGGELYVRTDCTVIPWICMIIAQE